MRVIILTGGDLRHTFMRKAIALAEGVEVLASYCEDKSAVNAALAATPSETSPDASPATSPAPSRAETADSALKRRHLEARTQSEEDFFRPFVRMTPDHSRPVRLAYGAINAPAQVEAIAAAEPDVLAAYGCSLVKPPLVGAFAGRFLNVHLGLSPYYRGSGTNFWPLVNNEPQYVGATFMHLDEGVDTGEIIHQIRAECRPGDTPHQIGNRLIAQVAEVYRVLLSHFHELPRMPQPPAPAAPRVCKRADFTPEAVRALYANFADGMVARYLERREAADAEVPLVTNPVVEAALSAERSAPEPAVEQS